MNEDTRPGCLLKFFEEQYVDNFITRGELHFSQLGYFIDLENGDDAIADSFEGARIMNIDPTRSGVSVVVNGMKLSFQKGDIIQTKETPDWVRSKGVLSMVNLDVFNDFDGRACPDGTIEYTIKPTVIDELNKLSANKTRVPVIINADGLLARLEENFKPWHAWFKPVSYYSESATENISNEELIKHPEQIMFLKREKYRYQREARISYFEDVPENGKSIWIGDLSSSTYKLSPDDGLNNFKIKWTKS
jgi:hypothetical protein